MLKNCSRCKSRHLPPFGGYCKKMTAVVPGFDRSDEKYLTFLEDEYSRRKMDDDRKAKTEPGLLGAGGGVIPPAPLLPPLHDPPGLDKILKSLENVTDRLGKLESAHASPHKTAPSTAATDLLSSPLTKALSHLSLEEEDKGRLLRPETYSQSEWKGRNRDHTKMDTLDLFYGWISVAEYLMNTGGDLRSYISHVKFSTQMLHSLQFYDIGAIRYDRQIIDDYVNGKASTFQPNTVVSSLTFSPRIIPESVELCHGASLTKGVRSYSSKQKLKKKQAGSSRPVKSDEVPADFPRMFVFFSITDSALTRIVLVHTYVENVTVATGRILVKRKQKHEILNMVVISVTHMNVTPREVLCNITVMASVVQPSTSFHILH